MSQARYAYPLYGITSHVQSSGMKGCSEAPGWPARNPYSFGTIASGVECAVPTVSDWHFLQPSEVNSPQDWWTPSDHLPVPCIFVTEPAAGAKMDSSVAASMAADAVRALRLLKPGWFLDPALSEIIFDDGRGRLKRQMGAYRMLCHDEDAGRVLSEIQDRYWLDPGDFAQKKSFFRRDAIEPTPLQQLFVRLRQHREKPAASLEIGLDAFNRSYGCQLSITQSLTVLCIGVEALLDPWPRASQAAEARRRIQSELNAAGVTDSSSSSDWLCSDVRAARNAIAHGREPEMLKNDLKRLTHLTRGLLVRELGSL